MKRRDLINLKLKAVECRLKILRMIEASGHGHVGGSMSAADIVTALYFYKMRINPKEAKWEDRDRFILSAGHKCLVQYAALAEKGFFPEEIMDTYGSLDSKIPGHPDMRKLPGIEANTGALGHGLSIAVGMALASRIDQKEGNVYVVMGDGELPEGSNWEAVAAAAHYHLSHLVVFVDFNGLQISGKVQEIMNMTPIAGHFNAFGWETIEIDGNNMEEIVEVLDRLPLNKSKPTAVIAHTVKAKGISFGEDNAAFHFWSPKENELVRAKNELYGLKERYEKELELEDL